jgi:hypothetical protein
MRVKRDLLFSIFEQQLQNSLVAEDTESILVKRVVANYIVALKTQGFIPPKFLKVLEDDLCEEVLEMYRKKTYGHLELSSYRKKHAKKAEPKAPPPSENFSKVQLPLLRQSKKQKIN